MKSGRLRFTLFLLLAVGVVGIGCGFHALIPAMAQVAHHASGTADPGCEEICFERQTASFDAAAVPAGTAPIPPAAMTAFAFLGPMKEAARSHPVFSTIPFQTSIKRYQLTRSYRL